MCKLNILDGVDLDNELIDLNEDDGNRDVDRDGDGKDDIQKNVGDKLHLNLIKYFCDHFRILYIQRHFKCGTTAFQTHKKKKRGTIWMARTGGKRIGKAQKM